MAIFANLVAGVVNSSGTAVSSGIVYFYEPGEGSTTLKTVYTDAAHTTPATNPYTLDGGGRAVLYGSGNYRIRVTDSSGTQVQDIATYDVQSQYADQVLLRNASGYVGTGDDYTGSTVDAALQTVPDSTGARDAKYKHSAAAAGVSAVTLQAKFSRWFDVKDFGAAGNDATSGDDATAINNAIAACIAAGGGVVWFPYGSYIVKSALTVGNGSGTELMIAGDGGATIRQYAASAPATFTLFNVTGTARVHFRDLILWGYGDNSSTASIGIAIPSNNYGSRIESCTFSGNSNGAGFNIGVSTVGRRTMIEKCIFERIYNTTAGFGVRVGTGNDVSIENCHFEMMDSGNTRGANGIVVSGSAGQLRISNCIVYGANGYGFDLGPNATSTCATQSHVTSCVIGSCSGGGVRITHCDDIRIADCVIQNNAGPGVMADVSEAAATGGVNRAVIANNQVKSNTGFGIHLSGTNHATAGHSTRCVISGNVVTGSTQCGIVLTAADDCVIANNVIIENSTANGQSGSHDAIRITTAGNTASTAGGNRNVLVGNVVRDSTTYYHRSCVDLTDSAGGNVNLLSTEIMANSFPAQNSGGTPLIYRVGGSGATVLRPNFYGLNLHGTSIGTGITGSGRYEPARRVVADPSPTANDSGAVFLCDVSGGSFAVTLPNMGTGGASDYRNGVNFTFVRYDSSADTNTLTINRSGNNLITLPAGSSTSTTIASNVRGACITLTYFEMGAASGVWVARAWNAATSDWA